MKLHRLVAAAALAVSLAVGGSAIAQDQPVPGLADAIAAGDTAAIDGIVAANQNNATVLAQIANTLLAAALAQKNSNPTNSALFAAIAVSTGALQGNDAIIALNIVSSNPAALALLTNPNAPKTGGNSFSISSENSPSFGNNNPANNSAQQGSTN